MNLKIRKADVSETTVGFELLKEAAVWLRERGIDYWQNWHDPPPHHRQWIVDGFLKNEFFFVHEQVEEQVHEQVEEQGVIVGMFRLQESDPMFWGNDDIQAYYIHSLTTKRNLYRKSYGYRILEMIEDLSKNNHKQFMRLDCGSDIAGLCSYYTKYGFQFIREIEADGYRMNLYQKPV